MARKNDLSIIKQLEAIVNKKFEQIPLTEIIPGLANGYVLNEETGVVGLNLVNTQITDISLLNGLESLTHLNLAWNRITDISPLHHATALRFLDISGNRVADISPLRALTGLTVLNLANNDISDVSPLRDLTALTGLSLYNNRVSDISPLRTLEKLERLDLTSNRIIRLPLELLRTGLEINWRYVPSGKGVFLEDNPLEIPPVEIVKQGDPAVRNYFKEIEKEKETVLLLHAKVLLVGSGAVGKTTLMKKLKDNDFMMEPGMEPTTHGINIAPWELDCTFADGETHPVKINLWDFGGQDIMYSTHQFFLTKRTLYLFVWEARQEGQEIAAFDYWLNIIDLLSAGSPVIVVMNKSDTRVQTIDEASYQNKFKNIEAFCQVSCLTGKGIPELRELIRYSLSRMNHLLDKLPKAWMEIRADLQKQKQYTITLEQYIAVCRNRGLDRERAGFLSDYLHDLGAILHFKREPLLENTVILDPEWATTAVYKIMDQPAVIENKGRFYYHELKNYWETRQFPVEKHPQLLRLMEKFELCYPVMGTDIHIVPELLPAQRPDMEINKYTAPGSLRLEIHYDFMPRGILSRFITRLYYLIVEEHFWKTGVEIAFENTFALAQSQPLYRKLTVSVTGPNKSELLAITMNHLEEIHRSLNMKKDEHYREMIPCDCNTCLHSDKPHLFPRGVLKKFAGKGITFNHCPISAEEVSIKGLLAGFALPPQKNDLKELFPTLIKTAAQLQGIAKTIRSEEDSRNSFIALILAIRGYIVKEQVKRGSSLSGKSMGNLDILVENPDGTAVSVIEAFNLTGYYQSVIDGHLQKIFNYDANGIENNFIVVYAESNDFVGLWQKYLNHVPKIDFKYKLMGGPVEEKTPYVDIKAAHTLHKRHDREIKVYHLFVNMKI